MRRRGTGWRMYPTGINEVPAPGELAADLLADVLWVTRRKEAIEVIDETLVRRRMSVDYDLPETVKEIHETSAGTKVFYAPLFFLQKGSDDLPKPGPELVDPQPHFAAFDVRD